MKIILANGAELHPFVVEGGNKHVQGANRDCLTFIFPANVGTEAIDRAFTEAACESITVFDNKDNEYIHKGYTIRAELVKKPVEVKPTSVDSEAAYEDRIVVTMAQRTYTESQLASLTDTVDVLVMESLLG